MNIKQKIRNLSFAVGVLASSILPMLIITNTTVANADSQCGGVTTSIIGCDQKGTCGDGTNPYEGSDPGSDTKKQASYVAAYKHSYGLCPDGKAPSQSVDQTGLWGLLLLAINILTAGVGVAAVGGIVYGSILYTTAGGSPEGVKKAREIITNVIIGIVAYALMYSLLNFIIPGGLFHG
jgi:hypothetical protein